MSVEIVTNDTTFTLSASQYRDARMLCYLLPDVNRVYIPFSDTVFKMAFGLAKIDVSLLPIWQESVKFCFAYATGWRGECALARECGKKCRETLETLPLPVICDMLSTVPYGISVVACSVATLWRESDQFRARMRREFNPFVPPTPALRTFVQCCEGILGDAGRYLHYYNDIEYIPRTTFWG